MRINLPKQIETKRLTLKPYTLDKNYIQLYVDSINQNLDWLQRFCHFDGPMTFEKQKAFLEECINKNKENGYAIWTKSKEDEPEELVGSISAFHFRKEKGKRIAELGIFLLEKFAKKGYAHEANSALESALFKAGLDETILHIRSDNVASLKSARAQGYTKIAENTDKGYIRFLFHKTKQQWEHEHWLELQREKFKGNTL